MTINTTKAANPPDAAEIGFDLSHLPVSLVVGITGHRDIREKDRAPLQSAIKSILLELKSKYPSTPLIVLSALAEGADQLAADVALSEEIRARLLVPMPMSRAAYEEDFAGNSLAQFRSLLSHADGFFELPLVEGSDVPRMSQQGPERNLQYETAGKYIAQKSQILIALWDGVETNLVGGTASVVKFHKEGLPQSAACSFEPQEGFPVYQVITPRERNPQPEGAPFERRVLYPESFHGNTAKAKKYYDHMFAQIDKLNRKAIHPNPELCREIARSKDHLLKGLLEAELPKALRAELNRYALVDALALRFQGEKLLTERILHGIVFMAFLLFIFFAHFSQNPLLLSFSFLLVLLGGLWQGAFHKAEGDTKFEDYRAMAEALRVRFFWKLLGLSDSVTDYYLGKQRSELDWIRNAFRGWDIQSDCAEIDVFEDLRRQIALAQVYWIKDQQNYFRRASERERRSLERIERWGKILVGLAIGIGLIVLSVVTYQSWPRLANREFFVDYQYEWKDIPVILIEGALAGAALLHNYGNGMAFREHGKQYARMESLFSQAERTLKEMGDPVSKLEYLRNLGKEALGENGDWVLLHRERPLDVPHP
jgi:hypothetical protein